MELGLNLQQHNQCIEIFALLCNPGPILRLFPAMAHSESFECIHVSSSTEGLNYISTRFLTPGYRVHFSSSLIIPPIASTESLQASNTVLAHAL
ncbi:hypothetical protein BS47DRAFT_1349833 [Hydnum rufescens UP504]|uniref:Uncharacterized protein n=1 Tax=Hydnum rufescens UP504 TaxID=1448309 RepID=A0A9P6ANT5_9AGAM|nr:hypothetical protein BS47DRAFT_1349833 [Hydnum rufescens UP504]